MFSLNAQVDTGLWTTAQVLFYLRSELRILGLTAQVEVVTGFGS
jgi:hypothetical protein